MIRKVLSSRCFSKMHNSSPVPVTSILKHYKCFFGFEIMVEVLCVNEGQWSFHFDLLHFDSSWTAWIQCGAYIHNQFYTFEEKNLKMSLYHNDKTMKK